MFRRAQEKQVSVAGPQQKGNQQLLDSATKCEISSELPEESWCMRWRWARRGVIFEIEHQQDEKYDHGDHENAEAFSAVHAPP